MRLIFDAVDRNAREYPDDIAFRFRDETLSHAGLASRSNRLANTLLSLGVARGDRVGIFCKQSLRTPVAVFGIQKAGAAYAPIDPQAPVGRLRRILYDLGIKVLITDDEAAGILTGLVGQTAGDENFPLNLLIGVDPDSIAGIGTRSWQDVDAAPDSPAKVAVEEGDLAYVITTSGSTGTPKGIMHTHFSGMAYARLSCATYAVTREDCLGNFVPLHFDISTFAYFVGPLTAAPVVIIPEELQLFPSDLVDLVESRGVSIWYSAPFPLIQIAQYELFLGRDLKRLRWIKFGGESMHPKYLRMLMQQVPGARFSNSYGPAEVNQCSYHHFSEPPSSDDPLPIGRIWAETTGLILGDDGEPVASGEEGELLIHSPTMMQGYWNRPDLNSKVFHYRQAADGQQKYYRTGDLVRENPDGLLVFNGRKDRQVKVRGYRVELDEIEAALVTHDQVDEAVALVTEDSRGSARIVASVTLHAGGDVSPRALVAHTRAVLPAYAVPASIDIVEEFPRTSTGKIDRLGLAGRMGENRR